MLNVNIPAFLCSLLISTTACAAQEHMEGVPPPGTPGMFTTWRVYSCPDAPECQVSIDVSIGIAGCQLSSVDLIDRNPNQKNQTIVWTFGTTTPGYEVEFRDPGIVMTEGGQDVDDVKHEKREHRKRIKQKTMTFLLYDILVEYRVQGSMGAFTACNSKGPAIVNRG